MSEYNTTYLSRKSRNAEWSKNVMCVNYHNEVIVE